MKYMGKEIDSTKLVKQEDVLQLLKEKGANNRTLGAIQERYEIEFDAELVQRCPISDGSFLGVVLVPVQEGILCLPYNSVDTLVYELFNISQAVVINEPTELRYYLKAWKRFSEATTVAMSDMLKWLEKKRADNLG